MWSLGADRVWLAQLVNAFHKHIFVKASNARGTYAVFKFQSK